MPSSENTGYLVQLQSPEGDNIVPIVSTEGLYDENGQKVDLSSMVPDAYTKAETLSSASATKLGLPASTLPADMFNVLAHAGDLHVWRRTVDGVVDYPVSTNRNAYQEGSDEQPAGYTLGAVITGEFNLSPGYEPYSAVYNYGSDVEVLDNGTVNVVVESSVSIAHSSHADVLRGKYCKWYSGAGSYFGGKVFFVPKDATFNDIETTYPNTRCVVDKYQLVTGYPAIPASTTIEYLGNLGDKVRMQIVSYVGTGVSGVRNPCSVTSNFPIDLSIMLGYIEDDPQKSFIVPHVGRTYMIGETLTQSFVGSRGFYYNTAVDSGYGKISRDKKTISWYGGDASEQFNTSGYKYHVLNIKF